MNKLTIIDYLFIFSLFSIWILLLINIILSIGGYIYINSINKSDIKLIDDSECPTISILVPAHNEEKVIYRTVRALIRLNYPKEKYEIIVINDNSSDNTYRELLRIQKDYDCSNLIMVNTDYINGGRGKSNALNIGYLKAKGEYIAVYDADNTPEKNALKYLVTKIKSNSSYGAVIGKFRTRNKKVSLLTKFINIETLSFQLISQGGRCKLLNLCTIPGTNFLIRKDILNIIGGWDTLAIAEDTEISFRIYQLGYKIAFMPLAVTWEQEPETIDVWFKQRSRWAKGNIYVLSKYIKNIFSTKNSRIVFDIVYFFGVYLFFLVSILISDIIFLLNIFSVISINVSGRFTLLWILAYILFILEISIALAIEKGESNFKNLLLVPLMYFTYCQMWIIVALTSLIQFTKDRIFKREVKWYKTERF